MYDATQLFEPVQLTEDEKLARFKERIEQGEKIEADDWMPAFYRDTLIKLISMHGISEIMGALPEKEWVPKAPSLRRKLGIMAKVQDEMGHGQLLLRVVEDLMKPYGKTRGDLMDDLFTGRLKFHNVFHMPTRSWADAGMILVGLSMGRQLSRRRTCSALRTDRTRVPCNGSVQRKSSTHNMGSQSSWYSQKEHRNSGQ